MLTERVSAQEVRTREGFMVAFSGNGNEAAKNQELERLVGKLYAENEFLKKALAILEKRILENKEKSKSGVKFMIISEYLDSVSVNRPQNCLKSTDQDIAAGRRI